MDLLTQFALIYVFISILTAAIWGRKRQVGFWWTLFLMSGFLPGWYILLNEDIRIDEPTPTSEKKTYSGLIIIILSSYLIWIIYHKRNDTPLSDITLLIVPLIWFIGLGCYLFLRGCGITFNRKNIPTPKQKPKAASDSAIPLYTPALQLFLQTARPDHTSVSEKPPISKPSPDSKSKPKPKANPVPKPQQPKVTPQVSGYQSNLLKVIYDDISLVQRMNSLYYPVLKAPKMGCVVRSHREGRVSMRGYKEQSFQTSLSKHFEDHFEVSGKVQLYTTGRPYEPDIALIDKRKDGCIRVDIEIDEPYDGTSRKAIHCKGDDEARDIYFIDRGWIVIRFSEYQVHSHELSCLKFVAEVLSTIHQSYSIPIKLRQAIDLPQENFWDLIQAQKWEKEKYREHYLGHEFKSTPDPTEEVIGGLNNRELEEENKVKPTYKGNHETTEQIAFNSQNKHPRDERIIFYPEKHIYIVDGVPADSVSTVIERRFPTFDTKHWARKKAPYSGMTADALEEKWRKNGEEAVRAGTLLHQQIESFFLKKHFDEIEEMKLFHQFIHDHPHLEPNRTEWRIFDERYRMAGTIDLLAKNVENHEIYDWKRSKKVIDPSTGYPITTNSYQSGFGGLSDIPDTSFNRYCLQQGLYRHILENRYDIKISKMFIIVLYPDYDRYHKLEVPYLKNKVEYILNTI
jgi:hypothetical protein